MKRFLVFLLLCIIVFSLVACDNDTPSNPEDENKTADIVDSTTDETPEFTEPVKNNEEILQYYNDVAYWIYSGIETHYNNEFDDAEFVCIINMQDGTWDFTNSEEPQGFSAMISDVISDVQSKEFKSGPKATGTALVKYQYGNLHYVQYTESSEESVQIIGQYADPTRIADGHIEWGVFHNRTRCDVCSNG